MPKPRKPAPSAAFLLRIPPQLKTALSDLARRERRSLNGQIEYLLEQAIAAQQPLASGHGPHDPRNRR